ncbi:hypothetical protein [Alteromonas gracilis]|uniref:hypothetical protein n=1 Tax=Alteromonas gracilis TaxID=1479524 RepID=UPI0030CCD07D
MEELTLNEIQFLVALLASEEANVQELEVDMFRRNVQPSLVQYVLKGLIEDGAVGITRLVGEEFHDFEKDDALTLICNWKQFVQLPLQLFLTDTGYKRWEVDDWGITTSRAMQLVFSNKGNGFRVNTSKG